jgi:hypothetical protein
MPRAPTHAPLHVKSGAVSRGLVIGWQVRMHDMGGLVQFATSLISNETLVPSPTIFSLANPSLEAAPKLSGLIASSLAVTSSEELLQELPCFLCGAHQHRRDVYTTSSPNRSRYVRPSCASAHALYTRQSLTITLRQAHRPSHPCRAQSLLRQRAYLSLMA